MLTTISKSISSPELRRLRTFGQKVNQLGANFAVCDAKGELVLLCEGDRFKSNKERLIDLSQQALTCCRENSIQSGTDVPVWQFGDENPVLAVVLRPRPVGHRQEETLGIALIELGNTLHRIVRDASELCNTSATPTDEKYLMAMLAQMAEGFQAAEEVEGQIEIVGTELARVYEELVLLHKLNTNMRVTESDAHFLQMACDSLTEVVSVEGIAILLDKNVKGERKLVVTAGSGLIEIDERMAAILHDRVTEEIDNGKEALLDSEVYSPFKYDWPDNIRNIIAVPLCGKGGQESYSAHRAKGDIYIIGLMVAINRIDKQDFDSTDVKLFNSVSSSCAVFIENGRLFNDLKELFIGSLKALTSSIDAKDTYTRGHSDRVAFISRWIAERLAEREPLEQEQIHKIYLAGLLHDIGKIGVEEAVLRKKGPLTEEELDRIRKHPSIGAGILRGIKQMSDIVPGVLCHHERPDGKGYPNGLRGHEIPLTGKIVGLADSFDAMTSKRTYRNAMTIEQALEEIANLLGSQFDETVGRVFLDSDVYKLWEIMQYGCTDAYKSGGFSEYDTAAVGTLIR